MAKKRNMLITPPSLTKRSHGRIKSERKKTLIVCEGTETEPAYFRDMIRDLKISNTDVIIEPGRHSNPSNVVQTALDIYEQSLDFEVIYCLIDTDSFGKNIQEAHDKLKNHRFSRRKKILGGERYPSASILRSDPCIEVWFLLHFEKLRRTFVDNRKSAAQNCKKYLKENYINDYDEKYNGLYGKIKHNIDVALLNSSELKGWLKECNVSNPFTEVDELIIDLKNKEFTIK